MNIREYHLLVNKPKEAKFRNRRIEHDGIVFDSIKERARWLQLCLLQRAGGISLLQRQVAFPIDINGNHICKYYADFVYHKNGERIIEDVKSIITRKDPVYRLKKKLLSAVLGITISEVI